MRFSAKITYLLGKNRLTQAELAKVLGISQPSVARWVTAGTKPHPSTAQMIAEYFGVGVDDLLNDERSLLPLGAESGIEAIPAFILERREIAKRLRAQAKEWEKWADELDPTSQAEERAQAKADLDALKKRAAQGANAASEAVRKPA